MTDTIPFALTLCGVFLIAGIVKGMLGLGLPTVAMGLLGLTMPPVQAAALLLLPSLVTNVWQLLTGSPVGVAFRRFWPMMLTIVVGTLASSGIIATAAGAPSLGLGVALTLYGFVGLLKPELRVPPTAEPWAGPLVGAATGVVTGATGVFVIPAVPYLGSLGLDRDELVQGLGLSFTVSTLALAGGLALHGALLVTVSATSLLAVVPALAGMWLGGWLRSRVRPEIFRRGFFVGLLLLGGELIWRGLT